MKITTLILTCIVTLPFMMKAQQPVKEIKIVAEPKWEEPIKVVRGNNSSALAPSFKNATYPDLAESLLPTYMERIPLQENYSKVEVELTNIHFTPLTSEEQMILAETDIPLIPNASVDILKDQGKPVAFVSVKPFGLDPETGITAKLDYFEFIVKTLVADSGDSTPVYRYPEHSRLSYGDWYKLWVKETGIYKITFEQLRDLGMQVNGIDPERISMFGNGGRMLNEVVGPTISPDMTEISIKVVCANEGVFAPGDYILFYGEGPVTWMYNTSAGRIEHATHPWANATSYFITVSPYYAKRIPTADVVTVPSNGSTNKYTALALYEKEDINLIKSGRKWFSHKLDNYTRTLNLPEFNFPNADLTQPIQILFGLAGKGTQQIVFNINVNGIKVNTSTIAQMSNDDDDYARDLIASQTFNSTDNKMKVSVQLVQPNSSTIGWFDFVDWNVRSNLVFTGPQMSFRDPVTVGEGKVIDFTLNASQPNLKLWDVTYQSYVHEVPMTRAGDSYTFRVQTPWLREFFVFDGTSFLTPEFEGKISNQDLHAISNVDMIIITPPYLKSQADRLSQIHKEIGDVSTKVVLLPQIYNEFSSGTTDITAIRNFMKMLYEKGRDKGYPKYLMLFGGSSYDTKDRILNNNNPIPTYQSYNSVKPQASYLSDDYYVLLDDGEGGGESISGLLDIGIGRLPVRTLEQAKQMVDKIETYLRNDSATHGDWRNTILVIGDDEDNNTHFSQAERLCNRINQNYPLFNVDKIYFDAYKQYNTPGGGRFPDAQRELNSHVEKGVMLTNYIGHGGELGWADERVLEIADIEAWKNFNQMGLFFTATCEFSRFDDPQHTSAGELVFLNPVGGAMSMITTTRLAYSSINETLNLSFIDTAISRDGGNIPRLGDILKYTKNGKAPSAGLRHLTLFGDPSMQMPLPKYSVVTTSIVDPETLQVMDTLSANAKAIINGEIHDLNGQIIDNFNGEVWVKVFDKTTTYRTLGQDMESDKANFKIQKNILYQGKAKVTNGLFNIAFPIPRDIDYNFGYGKISYYASDGQRDANGFYEDIVVGGSKSTTGTDEIGPEITLWINDSTFIEGSITGENPKLVVDLFDESGINTLSSGVGHDLTATLDGNSYNSVLLNDFYLAHIDSYKSGKAQYRFFGLEDGEHTITVKAWDVFNNSSEKSISFIVKHGIRLNIDDVTAYPNPSKGKVWFKFKHNLFDEILSVEIEIYNSTGELVRVLNQGKITASGYIVDEISWDGLSYDGTILRNGLYIARVKVLDRNGNSSAHSVKILMTK